MDYKFKDDLYYSEVLRTPDQLLSEIRCNYCLRITEVGMGLMDPQDTISPLTRFDIDQLVDVPEISDDKRFVAWLKQLKQEQIVSPTEAGYTVDLTDEDDYDDEE